MFKKICLSFFMTVLGLTADITTAQSKGKTLTVMIVPQFPSAKINETWRPMLDELSKRTGFQFELNYANDIPEFEKIYAKGTPDIIYCNPYHAVVAKKTQGYEPIVTDERQLKGLLIAKASTDSPIDSVQDLQGATILFPAPNAFGASLYMRALLTNEHKIDFKPLYVSTHPNVIRGVIRGAGKAGGMVKATLNSEADNLKEQVKVIYETPPAPSHPIAVHPRISEAQRTLIQTEIVKLIKENPALGEVIQLPKPRLTAYDPEYKALENLDLDKFAEGS